MDSRKKRRQNIYKVIMVVILTAVITFMITTIAMYNKFKETYSSSSTTTMDGTLTSTLEVFKAMINKLYIGDVDEDAMTEGAIKGYIEGLGDPYTEYLTPEEMSNYEETLSSEYVGIGVYVGNNTADNSILVVGVMKDSPAEEAGIQVGDVIEKIDGTLYVGEQLTEATSILKSKEGTTVQITILRNGEEKELTVTRRKIEVQHVTSEMLDNNIAYIQIDSFDDKVAAKFEEQIKELMNEGAKGIIIDLRSNGGGVVDEATDIAELFVKKGETILITKSKQKAEEITKSEKDPIIKDVPVVVLVNGGTASASEILAGALKEKYGATIVGNTTYGKGVIQTLYKLTNGGGIKITTDEYYTPNHNAINKVGIKPDVEVSLTTDENGIYETGEKDAQIKKAKEVLLEKMK